MAKPNIIYILADDLGYAEVGAYGQEKIETPNIDALAKNGMLFTQHYNFSVTCNMNAPNRSISGSGCFPIKVRKHQKRSIDYLTLEGIKSIFAQIDAAHGNGRRNLAMLALMYDSGARVQEPIDLTPSSIRLESPYIVKLLGKGRKERIVPIQNEQVVLLRAYMGENRLLEPHNNRHPLFFNCWRRKLTRSGVNYILKTYADMARKTDPVLVPERISCHVPRHFKAMHLL